MSCRRRLRPFLPSIPLGLYLRILAILRGHREVIDAIERALDILRARRGYRKRDDLLDAKKVRHLYRKAIREGKIRDHKALTKVFHRLGIQILDIYCPDPALSPFDLMSDGLAAVVRGGRQRSLDDPNLVLRKVVPGAYDLLASSNLEKLLRENIRVNLTTEDFFVPATATPGWLRAERARIESLPMLEVIVCMGSERVNPLSSVYARQAFGNMDQNRLPVRFQWSSPDPTGGYLAIDRPCRPEEEGIRVRIDREYIRLPRTPDKIVMERLKAGDRGPFDDAGVLIIDAESIPMTILCLGHGGAATLACTLGLGRMEYINECTLRAQEETGRAVVVLPIWVKRYASDESLVDGLSFSSVYDHGWGFHFDDSADEDEDSDDGNLDLEPLERPAA